MSEGNPVSSPSCGGAPSSHVFLRSRGVQAAQDLESETMARYYWYYATLMNYLGPAVYQGRVDMGDDTIYHFEFVYRDGGQTVSVLWYCPEYNSKSRVKPPEQVQCELEVGQPSDRVRVTRPVADSIDGESVIANWTDEGTVSLELSSTPVFVVVDLI